MPQGARCWAPVAELPLKPRDRGPSRRRTAEGYLTAALTRTGRAPPVARHPRHTLGTMVPGATTVPADARFHPTEETDPAETQQTAPHPMETEGKEETDPAETEQTAPHPKETEGKEETDPAETQQTAPHPMETEGKEGTESAGTQQTDPHPMGSEGKDAGSIPAPGINPTQLRATPTPAHPGGTGPEGSDLINNIITGVIVAAAGLLLLLLAFLCYRRKGPAPRQSRESEPATTVYALMGEGKQLDVLPQKPDPSAEGHTYAELDGQALQAKQGGAAPAPEPPLYSTITMSQGPNGQSPQGEAEPPTDPHSVNPGGVTGETGQEASATTG